MLSKKWLKFIKSLQVKKYRKENQAFLVEGAKSVQELLQSDYSVQVVFATEEFYQASIRTWLAESYPQRPAFDVEIATQAELEAAGGFESNNACLAVARMKPNEPVFADDNEFVLVLDEVKDPGNLGTIIRVADWYGIRKLVCSTDTADFYNPKVITASMGSFTRVQPYYCDLAAYLQKHSAQAVYGAYLQGSPVHETRFASSGYLVMGNESRGIRQELRPLISHPITIPRYGQAESLNVGIATAIICDNLRRATK